MICVAVPPVLTTAYTAQPPANLSVPISIPLPDPPLSYLLKNIFLSPVDADPVSVVTHATISNCLEKSSLELCVTVIFLPVVPSKSAA